MSRGQREKAAREVAEAFASALQRGQSLWGCDVTLDAPPSDAVLATVEITVEADAELLDRIDKFWEDVPPYNDG